MPRPNAASIRLPPTPLRWMSLSCARRFRPDVTPTLHVRPSPPNSPRRLNPGAQALYMHYSHPVAKGASQREVGGGLVKPNVSRETLTTHSQVTPRSVPLNPPQGTVLSSAKDAHQILRLHQPGAAPTRRFAHLRRESPTSPMKPRESFRRPFDSLNFQRFHHKDNWG